MNNKEKKTYRFLYTSSALGILLAGYSLIENDYIDTLAYISVSGGLYAMANSINDNNYIKNIKLYENMTKLATIGCILIPDIPYEPIPVVISLFVGTNMFLFSKAFEKERKQIKSKKNT